MDCLHGATSRTITCCLSFSHSPLNLFKASLPPLRVNLTYFVLSSYDRALRLPTSFPILGVARFEVKPRLCRSSWRAFASTHPLMLSPREVLLASPPSHSWSPPSAEVSAGLGSTNDSAISFLLLSESCSGSHYVLSSVFSLCQTLWPISH